ncbi:esterase-like activity of phytase family protein [Actinoplanes sp. NPDC048988]|uniref:esterase-like activity of phytase family protein n=1 Tax=Actinoplanes sp. NPDC048988 TaxID=3363901 RepID=UPI003723A2D4
MIRRLSIVAAAAAAGVLAASPALAHPTGGGPTLSLVDSAVFAPGQPFGGISGIDYDPRTGRYVAISDDRSALAPARYYTLRLPVSRKGLGTPVVTGVTTLRDRNGQAFANGTVDPEAVRELPGTSRLAWTSEGAASTGIPPFVRETSRDGSFRREYRLPAAYLPTATSGVRNNLALESLTVSADGRSLITATENALVQDGPAATLTNGSRSRVLVLDRASGRARAEYVYPVSPIAHPATDPANPYQDRGLTDLLTIDGTDFLAVERSYAGGVGFTIQIFWTTTRGATNAAGRTALTGAEKPMPKKLLFEFPAADNVEALTWGPRLPDGSRSLIAATDDNFGPAGTQFHLLRYRSRR